MSQNTTLRASLIRLAHENPALRADLLPLLKEAAPKTADLSLSINQIRLSYEEVMGKMEELGAYIEMEDARAMPTAREALRALAELNDELRRGDVVYRRAAEDPKGYYVRKYPQGNRYIWVEAVADGFVAGTGTYTAMDPDADGKGPKAADLDLEEKDLKAWKKVPDSKVPANWKKWFAANKR